MAVRSLRLMHVIIYKNKERGKKKKKQLSGRLG